MTPKEKIVYLGAIPLLGAAIGGGAVYLTQDTSDEQIVITGEAAKAAKDGQLTIKLIREDNTDNSWLAAPLGAFAMALMLTGMFWALSRN